MKLWIDTETFSESDIRRAGSYAYVAHPSTRPLLVQYALDDAPVITLDLTTPQGRNSLPELVELLNNPDIELWAHNATFDRAVVDRFFAPGIPLERWYCTAELAAMHGLPRGLGDLGTALGLDVDKAKDADGRKDMLMFCKPTKAGVVRDAQSHPENWARFLAYADRDVVAMREAYNRMPKWNAAPERDLQLLSWRINDKGVGVDLTLVQAAINSAERLREDLADTTNELTDGEVASATQAQALLKHILEHHGVKLPNMQADTLRRRLEDQSLPAVVRGLIETRMSAAKASTSKFDAMQRMVCEDSRIRGMFVFHGASRTGRWAGSGAQLHNMYRPTLGDDEIPVAIDAILADCVDLVFEEPAEALASSVRGCLVPSAGKHFSVSDLSNIEGRVLAWLAGERWKLKAFGEYDAGTGPDLYIASFAAAFGIPQSEVTAEGRQQGKVLELSMGYAGGVSAFVSMAANYGTDLTAMADAVHDMAAGSDEMAQAAAKFDWATEKGYAAGLGQHEYAACEFLKLRWRSAHPRTVALWADAEKAFIGAVNRPGEVFNIGPHIKARRVGHWVLFRLPSGRVMCYPSPRIDSGDGDQVSFAGMDAYARRWQRIKTFGGSLVENLSQAVARDVLAAAMAPAEAAGFQIAGHIHDELITETATGTSEELSSILATVPDWAKGLPLSAAGYDADRYRKG